ncbi:MAG: hypothetical protein KIT84_06225 [Labilithrix sp.]|nr:hypothetical protein [Labilithrix sp.]MCW5810588.1 hypothetical protein [Labilithrix sp.]
MGIDRIGKGGAPPIDPGTGAGGVGGVGKTGGVEKTFSVEGAEKTRGAGDVGAVDTSSPLARLRAGEIDVNGYVDAKVDEATSGLEGLPPSDLAEIKKVLRDQLVTDPGLVDLVTKATGSAAIPPEE